MKIEDIQVMTGLTDEAIELKKHMEKLFPEINTPKGIARAIIFNEKYRKAAYDFAVQRRPEMGRSAPLTQCALCGRKVGPAAIPVDGRSWCKLSHIPAYLIEREIESFDMNSVKDRVEKAIKDIVGGSAKVEEMVLPTPSNSLKEAMANHKCDNPDCLIKKMAGSLGLSKEDSRLENVKMDKETWN